MVVVGSCFGDVTELANGWLAVDPCVSTDSA